MFDDAIAPPADLDFTDDNVSETAATIEHAASSENANNKNVRDSKEAYTSFVRSGRLDNYNCISDIKNPLLRTFRDDLKSYSLSSEEVSFSLSSEVSFKAIHVRTGNNAGCWEEGGFDNKNFGRALFVTGPEGEKLPPIKVVDSDIENGHHALLAIDEGYHLLLACSRDSSRERLYLADYVVTKIKSNDKNHIVDVTCTQYGVTNTKTNNIIWVDVNNSESEDDDNASIEAGLSSLVEESRVKCVGLSRTHRVWNELCKCATTPHNVQASYIRKYSNHNFYMSDYMKCINDWHLMNNCQTYTSLAEAYATIDTEVSERYGEIGDRANIVVMSSFNYYASENKVAVYLFTGEREFGERKPFEPRSAYKVILDEGSTINYIDSDRDVTWNEAITILTKPGVNGCIANTVRRITK